MQRIALISAILDEPEASQQAFNAIVAEYKDLVRGRMGLPFERPALAVISIVVVGAMDQINAFTGRLGRLPGVTLKTAVSPRPFAEAQPDEDDQYRQ